MRHILLVCITLASFITATAQQDYAEYSSWNSFKLRKDISKKWSVSAEIHLRRTHFLREWQQFIIRPFVHYTLHKHIEAAVGYSYINNFSYAGSTAPIDALEYNVFQQLRIKQPFAKFSLSHRFRFEERFQQNILQDSLNNYHIDGVTFKNRWRYKFQVKLPLKRFGRHKTLSLVAYDEVHLDFGTGLRPEKLDQNWVFLGFAFRVSEQINIRSGYHDIYRPRSNFNILNHIWETTITYHM